MIQYLEGWALPNPTAAQEADLFRRYHAGDQKAKELIIRHFCRYAFKMAHKFRIDGYDQEDMNSLAMEGLIVAIDKYDPSRGTRFSTCATQWLFCVLGNETRKYFLGHGIRSRAQSVADCKRLMNPVLLLPVHSLQAKRKGNFNSREHGEEFGLVDRFEDINEVLDRDLIERLMKYLEEDEKELVTALIADEKMTMAKWRDQNGLGRNGQLMAIKRRSIASKMERVGFEHSNA
jgi:hypothetical protein